MSGIAPASSWPPARKETQPLLREVDSVPELSQFAFLVRPAKSVNSTLPDHRKPYKLKVRKGKDFAKLFTFCEFLKIG